MPTTFRLPDDLDGAEIVEYVAREGTAVRRGQPVVRVDVDGKKTEVPSDADAIVLRHLIRPGLAVGAGAPLAIFGAPGERIGFDPNAVHCVRVMLLRKCAECGGDYPVNALVDQLKCTHCGVSQKLSSRFWRDYLFEHVEKAKTPRDGSGTNVLGGKHGAATIQCVGISPLCRTCLTLLDGEQLTAGWQAIQRGETIQMTCACGEAHAARKPPPWAVEVFPKMLVAIGEIMARSPLAKPIVFSCPSCTAKLPIDGEKRIVHCRYCDSDVYLPSDLWMHLNPGMRRARWWMVFSV